MPKRLSLHILIYSLFTLLSFLLIRCNQSKASNEYDSPFRNTAPDVKYVGMEKCRKCHESVYQTFIETGMGQSFDLASREKSAADFSPGAAHVYDEYKNFHYVPFLKGDSMFIKEFRLVGTDTSYMRTEKVKYIVGSGQHTNSHMIEKNGFVYQAPITYYTQEKVWDMAPGFENGNNSRWDRKIQLECMSCHNAMPELEKGSFNRFLKVGRGIDCERCHGPGELHVREKEAGKMVDTSAGPDYSIVNPRKLSTDLQNNVCMRCHLQGTTVLADGKSFYDFRPGLKLSDFMTTFLIQKQGGEKELIMASHVERMMMSPCYIQSGKLSCITCHDPHISVKKTPMEHFNAQCTSCHPSAPHSNIDNTQEALNDCVSCHMPKTGSIDIPHVAVTDHNIRITEKDSKESTFKGIVSYNNPNPGSKMMAKGYMEIYERNLRKESLLDSAQAYLDEDDLVDKVRLEYLKNNWQQLHEIAQEEKAANIKDAWTAYRIGEGCYQSKDTKNALNYFRQASELMPLVSEFKLKYGVAQILNAEEEIGKEKFQELITTDPNYYLSYYNLAIYYQNKNKINKYIDNITKARELNPDI